MRAGLLLALTLVAVGAASADSLTLELRVFNGVEDVTSQTRVAVHRAGERTAPVVQLNPGHPSHTADVPPGIYDVQAIQERDGRVVNIRWVERLVVMPYPDENGRHLEVINFQNGFGALEVRRRDRSLADVGMFRPGDHSTPTVQPIAGSGYILFVAPAGAYDVQTRSGTGAAWHMAFEVPLDRTRFWIVP
jgi:hypothetical protein